MAIHRSEKDAFKEKLQGLFESTEAYYEEICNVLSKSLVSFTHVLDGLAAKEAVESTVQRALLPRSCRVRWIDLVCRLSISLSYSWRPLVPCWIGESVREFSVFAAWQVSGERNGK